MTKQKDPKPYHKILKYSGMVFQMFILLAIAVYAGRWIDQKMGNEKPYIMLALLVFSLIGYMYKMIVDLSKDSK